MAVDDHHRRYTDEKFESCRRKSDEDIHELRKQMMTYTITPEQAEDIATRAAEKAKIMTKKELIDDVKMDIADAAISILTNSMKAIAVFVVGLGFYVGSVEWSKFKWPWGN